MAYVDRISKAKRACYLSNISLSDFLKTNSSEFHYMQIIYITYAITQSIFVMLILWLNTQEDYSIISYGYLVITP